VENEGNYEGIGVQEKKSEERVVRERGGGGDGNEKEREINLKCEE